MEHAELGGDCGGSHRTTVAVKVAASAMAAPVEVRGQLKSHREHWVGSRRDRHDRDYEDRKVRNGNSQLLANFHRAAEP